MCAMGLSCLVVGMLSFTALNFISRCVCLIQNHWFTYNEKMSIESVTQAVSNLALAFGDDDSSDPGTMVQ